MSPSSVAGEYNWFFWILVVVCGSVASAIAAIVIYCVLRYHRKSENELPPPMPSNNIPLEIAWTAIPLFIFMGMFAYGAKLYFDIERPPDDALQVYVVAKQWMWKTQQLDGAREINELHVPAGQDIKLLMTSQDVIHSFYVPAFRIKQDVIPGRYTSIWFRAEKPGKYHLFCAEYCGTNHSGMIGWIYVLERQQYQHWLQEGAAEGSLASSGEKLFHQFGCANCHHFDGHGPGPDLIGLYDRPVQIKDMGTVIADDSYIRESIVDPRAKIVLGFDDIMPTFKGQLSEEQIVQLISYVKALGPPPGSEFPASSGSTPHDYGTQKGIAGPGASAISTSKPETR